MRDLRGQGKMFADLDTGGTRLYRLELAAYFAWRIGLHIEGIQMTAAATHPNDYAGSVAAQSSFGNVRDDQAGRPEA